MDPAYIQEHLGAFLDDLRELVEIESPSNDLPRLERAAAWIQSRFIPWGALETFSTPSGPLLRLERPGQGTPTLLLAHFDTVHPVGSFGWRQEDRRAIGPGIYDMKGGIVALLWALRAAQAQRSPLPPLRVLFTPDEEIGSPSSRPFIEAEAQSAEAVLVLEPPTPEGDLKLARKGVGHYRLEVFGRAAHQGNEPERGVNAILELAEQILQVSRLANPQAGTTLGPNRIGGGTATNVVAAHAWVEIDLRVWTSAEAQRVEAGLRALRAHHPEAQIHLEGGLNRPPMEPSPASQALFERARQLGLQLGLDLKPARAGGGSDGNFTAALGRPTLDGLGLFGGGAHTPDEWIDLTSLPARVSLLQGLLAELGR
jgi:glutamate carboxypeptidase